MAPLPVQVGKCGYLCTNDLIIEGDIDYIIFIANSILICYWNF